MFKDSKGFTLLELLIVIAIIGLLASVVIVQFPEAQKRARLAQAQGFADTLRGSLQGDMVANWTFDETSGSTAEDLWIDQLDGTVSGATWADGIINGALSFDGVNDYVSVPSSPNWNFGVGDFSIGGWWYFNTVKQNQYFNDIGSNGTRIQLYQNVIYLQAIGGTTAVSYSWIPNTNQWYHVFATRNNGTVSLYIDGKLVNSATYAGALGATATLTIGNYGGHGGYCPNGLIDDVQIYSAALPLSAIQKIYAQGFATHQNFVKK